MISAEIVVAIPATLAAVGFLAGMLGLRYPKAPWIATAAMVLAYIALLAVSGAWARDCPGCYEAEATRKQLFVVGAWVGFLATIILVLIVWIGTLVPELVRGVLYWVRPPHDDAQSKAVAEQ